MDHGRRMPPPSAADSLTNFKCSYKLKKKDEDLVNELTRSKLRSAPSGLPQEDETLDFAKLDLSFLTEDEIDQLEQICFLNRVQQQEEEKLLKETARAQAETRAEEELHAQSLLDTIREEENSNDSPSSFTNLPNVPILTVCSPECSLDGEGARVLPPLRQRGSSMDMVSSSNADLLSLSNSNLLAKTAGLATSGLPSCSQPPSSPQSVSGDGGSTAGSVTASSVLSVSSRPMLSSAPGGKNRWLSLQRQVTSPNMTVPVLNRSASLLSLGARGSSIFMSLRPGGPQREQNDGGGGNEKRGPSKKPSYLRSLDVRELLDVPLELLHPPPNCKDPEHATALAEFAKAQRRRKRLEERAATGSDRPSFRMGKFKAPPPVLLEGPGAENLLRRVGGGGRSTRRTRGQATTAQVAQTDGPVRVDHLHSTKLFKQYMMDQGLPVPKWLQGEK